MDYDSSGARLATLDNFWANTTSAPADYDDKYSLADYANASSSFDLDSSSANLTTIAPAKCKPQEYYSFNYAVVGTLFQSIIFVVGVLGNVLVCAVVRRTRSMHSTTNCYLVSLAVADTITLVASVPQEVLSYHIIGDQWVWGPVGCTLMIYLQYLGIDASALSLTAFTVERYIAICHPMKSKSICTLSRAKKIIAACWLFAIVYCSPWFLLTQTRTVCVEGVGEVSMCGFRLRRDSTEYLLMFFTDIVLFYVVPLLASLVLYALIARMLLNSKNKFPGGLSNGTAMSVSEAAAKSNQSRVQVVKMLACVVTIFATLWVPYRGLLVYNSFATINHLPPYLDLWYLMFAKTCIYMNCAINPILYNAMSDKFRKAFRRLLSCGIAPNDVHIQRYRFQTRRGLDDCSTFGGSVHRGGGRGGQGAPRSTQSFRMTTVHSEAISSNASCSERPCSNNEQLLPTATAGEKQNCLLVPDGSTSNFTTTTVAAFLRAQDSIESASLLDPDAAAAALMQSDGMEERKKDHKMIEVTVENYFEDTNGRQQQQQSEGGGDACETFL